MDYSGIIIEESLLTPKILDSVQIVDTIVEPVTDDHHTPWLEHWTMHQVKIPEANIDQFCLQLIANLDFSKPWYSDFRNSLFHYIVFRSRIFKIDLAHPDYSEAINFGLKLGIPMHQLDFKL